MDFRLASGPPPERVRVYVDESRVHRNAAGHHWSYVGVLVVPERRWSSALASLSSHRVATRCDSEVHFANLTNEKTRLALAWAKETLYDDRNRFHFSVLGINHDRLCRTAFGSHKVEQLRNAYMRVLRMAVAFPLKAYFAPGVTVTRFYHDRSNDLEQHEFFEHYALRIFMREHPEVRFECPQVLFVDSDHRKDPRFADESHFIQLTDLILGAVRLCLDATSTKTGPSAVAEAFLPLVQRLLDPKQSSNPNSRFHHYRRCHLSFFPSRQLTQEELADPFACGRSTIYQQRTPLFGPGGTQQSFEMWTS